MKTDTNSVALVELSILRNRVSEALSAYYKAPLGSPYEVYEMLKNCRSEYKDACCQFVEKLIDTERKECENVSAEMKILLEKIT
jgi:hypothetical protein